MGLGIMGGRNLDEAFTVMNDGLADTVIILENDLYRRADAGKIDAFLDRAKHIIVPARSTARFGKALTVVERLQAGVRYVWDVTACPDTACSNSATYKTSSDSFFTTAAATTVMVAPTPSSPSNNATGQSLTPSLQWTGGTAT